MNQTVAVLPLEFLSSIMGQPVAGLIGYDFISQFVIEVDYAMRRMNLYAAAAYRYLGSGDVLPIKFIDKRPFVAVKITLEGREAIEGAVGPSIAGNMKLKRLKRWLDAASIVFLNCLEKRSGTSKEIFLSMNRFDRSDRFTSTRITRL